MIYDDDNKERKHPRIIYFKAGRKLTEELITAFKAECSARGTTMTKVFTMLITRWLKEMR